MDVSCSSCGGTNIEETNMCSDCGNVVCSTCGNEGEGDGWDESYEEDGMWYTYCKGCGSEIELDFDPFGG